MASNTLEEPGKKSVRTNRKDIERAEKLGISGTSASTAMSELLEDAEKFDDLKESKRQELESEVLRIKEEAEEWGINPQSVGVTTQ